MPTDKPTLYIHGMHGMGDNIHQRAIMRQLREKNSIVLETSWPSIYHDMPDIRLARRNVNLRTQQKNSEREADKFSAMRHGLGMRQMRIAYSGSDVKASASGTILEVMCKNTGTDFLQADFRLPVPDAWNGQLFKKLGPLPKISADRPWLVMRPLVGRTEWTGSLKRNADPVAYKEVYEFIRDSYFVVSIADLAPPKEWLVGDPTQSDLSFHHGELVFEDIAALFKQSDLVLTSSGFAAILAPAVETPVISIIGGYETPGCHDAGKRFTPMLTIGPASGCSCWTSSCRNVCPKYIDLNAARSAIASFLHG
jgi:hypothetical protein